MAAIGKMSEFDIVNGNWSSYCDRLEMYFKVNEIEEAMKLPVLVATVGVAYASRTLTSAELNYSQIHKEALAIVYAVKKYHQYLYGRKFILKTDHKPLISIFGPHHGIPNMTASRLQRWAMILSAYNFDIEYISSDKNIADSLSRMISTHKESDRSEGVDLPEQTYLHFASEALLLDHSELKQCTIRDSILSRVVSYITDGWPTEVESREFRPYFNRKNELYLELGCVMWGHRVVVPEKCRVKVLKELHDSHLGISKTKSVARSYVWWPGVDEAVEAVCRGCAVCAAVASAPPAHIPRPWPWPQRPWSRLHLDFLGPIGGATYLVVVDAHSKWLEIFRMSSTSAKMVISKLRELWSRFGIPKQIVSDNGPPFSSLEFANFVKSNGVKHIFSAPYHAASNGAAENSVKLCKRIIHKAVIQGVDVETALYRFLLMYRNTTHCTTGESPARLLQGRSLRCRLNCLKPDRHDLVLRNQNKQIESAGGVVREFQTGQQVWYRNYRSGPIWLEGVVKEVIGGTNYKLLCRDGTVIHRHVDQMKLRYRDTLATGGVMDAAARGSMESSPLLVYPVSPSSQTRAKGVEQAEVPRAASVAEEILERESSPSVIRRFPLRERKPPRPYVPV